MSSDREKHHRTVRAPHASLGLKGREKKSEVELNSFAPPSAPPPRPISGRLSRCPHPSSCPAFSAEMDGRAKPSCCSFRDVDGANQWATADPPWPIRGRVLLGGGNQKHIHQ